MLKHSGQSKSLLRAFPVLDCLGDQEMKQGIVCTRYGTPETSLSGSLGFAPQEVLRLFQQIIWICHWRSSPTLFLQKLLLGFPAKVEIRLQPELVRSDLTIHRVSDVTRNFAKPWHVAGGILDQHAKKHRTFAAPILSQVVSNAHDIRGEFGGCVRDAMGDGVLVHETAGNDSHDPIISLPLRPQHIPQQEPHVRRTPGHPQHKVRIPGLAIRNIKPRLYPASTTCFRRSRRMPCSIWNSKWWGGHPQSFTYSNASRTITSSWLAMAG